LVICATAASTGLGQKGREYILCIKNRLKALQEKHAAADAQIQLLELNPRRDEDQIRKLKKIKLGCRDEITRLENPATASKPKKPLSKTKQKKLHLQTMAPVHQLPQSDDFNLGMKKVA
jgi:hypothetical protein